MPDTTPSCILAPDDQRERLTKLLHKHLDQEHQPGLTPAERQHLATLHKQIRQDLDTIRYQTRESTLRAVWRKYQARR